MNPRRTEIGLFRIGGTHAEAGRECRLLALFTGSAKFGSVVIPAGVIPLSDDGRLNWLGEEEKGPEEEHLKGD